MGDETSERASTLRRRTLLGGAAWAVPTVVAAVGVPALAASQPTITFDSVVVFVDHREDPILLDGHVTGTALTRPAVVAFTYTEGFTGDPVAVVDAETGNFRATAYADVGPSTGTATAVASGYRSASVGMQVDAA